MSFDKGTYDEIFDELDNHLQDFAQNVLKQKGIAISIVSAIGIETNANLPKSIKTDGSGGKVAYGRVIKVGIFEDKKAYNSQMEFLLESLIIEE